MGNLLTVIKPNIYACNSKHRVVTPKVVSRNNWTIRKNAKESLKLQI